MNAWLTIEAVAKLLGMSREALRARRHRARRRDRKNVTDPVIGIIARNDGEDGDA
jgi:hypothetical protein